MELRNVTVTSAIIDSEREAEIRRRLSHLADLYRAFAEQFAVPDFKLDILITDSFARDVDRLLRLLVPGLPAYDSTRGTMVSVARAVPLLHDWRETCLVFDSTALAGETVFDDALSLFLMAHELSHPIMSLVQREIGAIPDQDAALGLSDTAKHAARVLAEEYRADQLAELLLRKMVTVSPTDAPDVAGVPGGYWDLDGPRFENATLESVRRLPALADEIDEYRNGRSELMPTVSSVTRQYGEALTQLVHLQAARDESAGDTEGPDILGRGPFHHLPEVLTYFEEPWRALIGCIRQTPPLYGVEQARHFDERLATVGGQAIVDLWKRFGISFEEFPGGAARIDISQPRRP